MTVIQQLNDVAENFVNIVTDIEKSIDSADWDNAKKELAHSILLRIPLPSNWFITTKNGIRYLKELEVKRDIYTILPSIKQNGSDESKIWLPSDTISFVKEYLETLLSEMSKYSKVITFEYSGHDATEFPKVTFYIRWDF